MGTLHFLPSLQINYEKTKSVHLARGNKNYSGDLMENSLIRSLVFSYLMFALQYTGKQNAHNIETAIVSRKIQQQFFSFSSVEAHSYSNYSAFI